MPERTFDVRPSQDPMNRSYLNATRLAAVSVPRVKRFWPGPSERIDQGREGACVGFAWTNEIMSTPLRIELPNPNGFALSGYRDMQIIDEFPDTPPAAGTSVGAGAKWVRNHGYMLSYYWVYTIDDLIDAVITTGPVVIGIPWQDAMYDTRPSGLVEIGGSVVGGHAILVTGYHPSIRLYDEPWTQRFEVLKWRNSWGPDYGRNGDGYIEPDKLEALLLDWGEGAVAVGRRRPAA